MMFVEFHAGQAGKYAWPRRDRTYTIIGMLAQCFANWAIHSRKRASCSKSAAGLLPCCYQADIRMRSHRLLRLDYNKSAASWLFETFYPCKLFQQLVASLQMSSCNKSDFHRLSATWRSQQTWCNLLTTCSKPVKSTTCSKSANIKLQQVWFSQTCCNLMKSTDLMQLVDNL